MIRTARYFTTVVLVFAFAGPLFAQGNRMHQIGFTEEFALAADRTVPLSQLIPGTEDYYYFHCLHYQNQQQFDKVDALMKQWASRRVTSRFREIQYRQMLLTYDQSPDRTLAFLKKNLGLNFNHEPERLDEPPKVPSELDQNLISRQRLLELATKNHKNLDGVEDSALTWLATSGVKDELRRALLKRLARPDLAELPKLIVADLQAKNSGGFGSMPIHKRLLLNQLDELMRLKPDLRNNSRFVSAYVSRLAPSADVDIQQQPKELQAWLERMWSFVKTLSPAHNSLKAHVLYHRLVFDQQAGERSKERFLEYIKLPRKVGYVNRDWMRRADVRRYTCNLNEQYAGTTSLPAVGNDEPLVRDYLHHFFVKAAGFTEYSQWMNDDYLKHNFAEAKIVNGLGDPEKWYSLLPPEKYQALKDRIDLDFLPTNKRFYDVNEPVSLELAIKNVPTLIVKVFEINTVNFHRENQREVNTDINLDGLVANDEKTFEYKEPALRRTVRKFDFPQLNKRGTYVVDFIGNGMSSRAIIRKGQLRFLAQTTPAGHAFRVFNETNSHVKDASLFLGGQLYEADDNGRILVPFSTRPGRQPVVIAANGTSSLGYFNHEAESYSLSTGFFVDRESLLRQRTAEVVIRSQLNINGQPISLRALSDVSLEITSTAHDGIESKQKFDNFRLFEDRESVQEFSVPARLSSIQFVLSAKVKQQTTGNEVDLAGHDKFVVNQIDKSDRITHAHLIKHSGGYAIELLGLTGEQRDARPINLKLKHRDFKDEVHVTLATNVAGLINLGPLKDIVRITATGDTESEVWHLREDRHTQYQAVHVAAGEPIRVPVMAPIERISRADMSLLQIRNRQFVSDHFDALKLNNGYVTIQDLPAGDYELHLHTSNESMRIRVTDGKVQNGFVMGQNRQLEQRGLNPLQIESIKADDTNLTIKLQNATKFARVHLLASRFVPAFDAFDQLAATRDAEPLLQTAPLRALSAYIEGRNIGDEYRYILERRYATRFPGNMNARPGMILNPFALRETDTGDQDADKGDVFSPSQAPAAANSTRARRQRRGADNSTDFANLDFLAKASIVEVNLVPDENGVITVKLADIGPRQHIHVVAADPMHTAIRSLALDIASPPRLDLRLAGSLKLDQHFTQQKRFRFLPKGESVVIEKSSSARLETIDSLSRLYELYATLNADEHLNEFAFILGWPDLEPQEKRTLYSRYACHELSFFLKHKDPEFFKTVIQPYLSNKMHKTFMDHWLLEYDLHRFLSPWAHARLNVAEQILLSDRIDGEADRTSRYIADRADLKPVNLAQLGITLGTALQGRALRRLQETESLMELSDSTIMLQEKAKSLRFKKSQLGRGGGLGGGGGVVADDVATFSFGVTDARGRTRGGRSSSKEELGEELDFESKFDGLSRKSGNDDVRFSILDDFAGKRVALYRQLNAVQEWVENNYYKLPIESQLAELIRVNDFWRDYAARDRSKPFVSENAAFATSNFTEMMLALAVTDLPFVSPKHMTKTEDGTFTFTAAEDLIVVQDEIRETPRAEEPSSILVSQNFFAKNDRYRHDGRKKMDKFVKDEFVINTVYGCQISITNPTSAEQTLTLLLQLPVGSIPVANGEYTKAVTVQLGAYSTQTQEYYFYFPVDGEYAHYPVQVESDGRVIAFADSAKFKVVEKPTTIDRESWEYISQFASSDQVIEFLKTKNLQRVSLSKIAWRMKDKEFFNSATQLLHERHMFDDTLWAYSVMHNNASRINQFLAHRDAFIGQCGQQITSPLLVVNPVERHSYQHRDYSPLVNARAHQLGAERTILNDRYREQYQSFMKLLSYQRDFDDEQRMSLTYYLLLQDRVAEAQTVFKQVNADKVAAKIQYDYCAAYLDFFADDPQLAAEIVDRYTDYPVDRWRDLFASMKSQLDEIQRGEQPKTIDPKDAQQANTQLAASDCSFDLEVNAQEVAMDYQNLQTVQVNYYLMDIELLFSRNPFVQQDGRRFSNIKPNQTEKIQLPDNKESFRFALPEKLRNTNVLVEVVGRGMKKSAAYYANSLAVQMIDNYGQVRVTDVKSGKPLSRVYVKTYARMNDGRVQFFKDGYTDLRGRFDYASLNTDDLNNVRKFAVLVLSDTHGATVEETNPPKQ